MTDALIVHPRLEIREMADTLILPNYRKQLAEKDANLEDLHICLIPVIPPVLQLRLKSINLLHTTVSMGRSQLLLLLLGIYIYN